MKTIIAEKPSVAREIARIVGATKREEGYFEGGGYAVTWAFGHLVQLAMPDGYGVRGFVRDNLPIIPDTFTLVPRQVRTEKGYNVTRNFAASLFRNIKYFTLRKLYLCRKWMQKRLQKTTTTGITLPNFDFLA